MSQVRVRIAPSPTGMPHIGTIFQALINYAFAIQNNGKFIVRIEDTDQARIVKGAEKALFDSLDWFGLTPSESPKHHGNFGPYRQSEKLDIYKKYAHQLIKDNKAYFCFCSPKRLNRVRKDMQKQGKPPMYDKKCSNLDPKEATSRAKSQPHVIRMKILYDKPIITLHDDIRGDINFDKHIIDDQVILKSDGFPTYHLAVVVDDHEMKITHVVRGEEWISSTPKHVLLYQYFGWDVPSFIHTPLLRNPDRSKLSKRHGHSSVSWYQQQGYLPEAVLNFLATRVWNHPNDLEIFGIDEFIKHFSFQKMHIQGPIVDLDKLNWINGQWIRKKPDTDLIKDLQAFRPKNLSQEKLTQILPLIKERLETLSQLKDLTSYFISEPKIDPQLLLKEAKVDKPATADYIIQVSKALEAVDNWSVKTLETSLRNFQKQSSWKPRPAFMTIRIAITGRTTTPPLFDTMQILGKDKVLFRLSHAQKILKV